jgi:uncharacterized protein YjiS (DUF1127 family)
LKEKAMFRSSVNRRHQLATAYPPALASILTWLGDCWLKMHAVNELSELSDADLKDIGVDRREIGSVVDRELARLRRSDLTWRN